MGIVTGYGLGGPGIESRWGRDFLHLSRLVLGPTQLPVQWVPGLYRGKERPGRAADPSPLLVPWSRKSRAIPLLPQWGVRPVQSLSACTRFTLPLPIPLLPLWTVRSIQSLSACTRVHFIFTYTSTPPMDRTAWTEPQCLYNGALYLYLYSPYGPYGLYRASVPVQGCTSSLPIPLLPLWTVRSVQSLSACTRVHFICTYTSTPPMDRTACTEPECLYNGALYLYLYLYSPYGPYGLCRA